MNTEKLDQIKKDRALIKELGGLTKLSRKLGDGYTTQRINNWMLRGIPAREKLKHRNLLLVD